MQVEAQREGDGNSAEAGVWESVADERHPLEDDEAADDGRHHANQDGGY
ncbi:MAG: hypothetical protein V3T00_04915 [bacterium]